MRRFAEAVKSLPGARFTHAANSAGAFRLAKSQWSLGLVRPGIFLYGGAAAPSLPRPAAVATLRARVVSLREVPKGETVSYGAEWRATRRSTIATVAIGYADGIPRRGQGKGKILIRGKACPLVGRITMDFVMADVTGRRGVAVGDVATVWGRDGKSGIALEDWAGWSGTNSYELLVRLGDRVERVYL
jgi:alanine racemase